MLIRITILSDNYTIGILGLKAEHGFSALIEVGGKSFLYDTGQLGIAADNALVLKKDLRKVSKIMLSHGHIDHTGGLKEVLTAISHPVEIIAHKGIFDKKYSVNGQMVKTFIGIPFRREYLEGAFGVSFKMHEKISEVDKGLWLTGKVPFTNKIEIVPGQFQLCDGNKMKKDLLDDDNTLVIKANKGLVVILGCGHRGVINILTYIKAKFKANIIAVIGGTHLHKCGYERLDFVKTKLRKILRQDKTKIFAPAHCTGMDICDSFSREFSDIIDYASSGKIFEF